MTPFIRYLPAHGLYQEIIKILRPGDRHGSSAERVFEYKIPPNDPCDEFTHRCVRISISTTCNGNHGGKFCVAKSCKCTTYGCNDKRDDDRRACMPAGG